MNLVLLVPVVGIVAAPVLVPPFSVGFMAASRAAARGGPVGLEHLFSGFRERFRGQLVLGLVFLACLALLLGATTLFDRGALAHSMLVRLNATPYRRETSGGALQLRLEGRQPESSVRIRAPPDWAISAGIFLRMIPPMRISTAGSCCVAWWIS